MRTRSRISIGIMAGRFCNFSSIFTVVLIEIAVMLSFWVGDYWTPIFSKHRKPCDVTNSSIVRKLVQKVRRKFTATLVHCEYLCES